MNLLIITQKVDSEDPILGFFHNWILELSKKFEKVCVICLEKGEFNLPKNVQVFSLGKESKRSKIKYIVNLYRYILGLHDDYDAVFVHMNQEYVILGGFLWKIMRKKIFLWRNHQRGNTLTRMAVWLSHKVFCTSKFSYTAKFKKTKIMPVGIDIERFKLIEESLEFKERKNKILFLGRMSPIKRPELLIDSLDILNKRGIGFVCDFYGDSLPKDAEFYDFLKNKVEKNGLNGKVNFYGGVANYETPEIYNRHEIFVNLTPSGSFDKTILEAAACGCVLVVTNKSLEGKIDERMITNGESPDDIAGAINLWLNTSEEEKKNASLKLQKYVLENHSLNALIEKLCTGIKK